MSENPNTAALSKLAQILVKEMSNVEALEAALKERQAAVRRLAEEDLPIMMAEFGVEELKLSDGTKVSIVKDIFASIPVARRPEAFDWLRAHQLQGVIKTTVSCEFGRGENDKAVDLAVKIQSAFDRDASVDETVHPATLKSLMKEQLEAGELSIPFDLFGIREVRRAKVVLPSNK